MLLLVFTLPPVCPSDNEESVKLEILLTPVVSLTENEEFSYLKGIIYNVLLINMKSQETLSVLNDREDAETVIMRQTEFEDYVDTLKKNFPGASAVMASYYVDENNLHLIVNVWDLDSLRVRKSFIETMPADLDMLGNIEKTASRTAIAVAEELPPTLREALFEKQIVMSLRKKINDEEKRVEEIFSHRNEICMIPFTGIGLGRTVVSWSTLGPFVSPVLGCEYSFFPDDRFHLRVGVEYLCFDVLTANPLRYEITFEALAGVHSLSLFSLSLDAGIALIYDNNPSCAALTSSYLGVHVTPDAERLSISLPLRLGLTVYISRCFFIQMALKYHGLTWTIETEDPEAYDVGRDRLKYIYGLSPWNLLCLSFVAGSGVRF